MADTATLANMRGRVRRAAHMETSDQANAFVTDAEINAALNAQLRVVYGKLVDARGASFFRALWSFYTVAGTTEYALPAAFHQLLGVGLVEAVGVTALVEAQESELAALDSMSDIRPQRYHLRGAYLALLPTPSSAMPVRVPYVPAFTPLAADSDTFDGVAGFEERAIWAVVAELVAKDQRDPSFAMAQVTQWDEIISGSAPNRDAGGPPRINRRYRQRWGIG